MSGPEELQSVDEALEELESEIIAQVIVDATNGMLDILLSVPIEHRQGVLNMVIKGGQRIIDDNC